MSRYCGVFVISAFYMANKRSMADKKGIKYLILKAVKFYVEFYDFLAYNI